MKLLSTPTWIAHKALIGKFQIVFIYIFETCITLVCDIAVVDDTPYASFERVFKQKS